MISGIGQVPSPEESYSAVRARRGFTLIEMLIVLAVIMILAAIGVLVGVQVKANAAKRYTHATLVTVAGIMKDYLAAGNPDIPIPVAPPSNTPPYDTLPPSDPVLWVRILRASQFSAKLGDLKTGVDSSGNVTVLDAWGTPIRYIPMNTTTKQDGYFQSFGVDRSPSNPAIAPATAPPSDDLFSTDAF